MTLARLLDTRPGFSPGELCGLAGGAVPLPASAASGDPRLPLDARYPGPDDYRLAVQRAAERLVAERLLLREDADAAVAAARAGTLARLSPPQVTASQTTAP